MTDRSRAAARPGRLGKTLRLFVLFMAGAAASGLLWYGYLGAAHPYRHLKEADVAGDARRLQEDRVRAPELDGGVEWLNTSGPLRLKDLRGKVVLLDFWTFCCINCIHVLPDLARLEKKYPNELVVIGVHSAKFDTEKDGKNIRDAILRYNIEHPVVNDANHKIWNAYGVRSWPTFMLIDPEGYVVGYTSGEGNYEVLDQAIAKVARAHREKKTLNEQPVRFDLAKFRERKTTPLFFPGKVLADAPGGRLFIADSSHHRIVITDLAGRKIDVAGTGQDGRVDGPFEKASFNDPQGMALAGDVLFVADRKNHLVRALDLKGRQVKTVAGVGEQGHDRRASGDPRTIGLNSPWDLLLRGNDLYIAMAGHHQVWKLDLAANHLAPYAGSGREDIYDDTLARSALAQPSGLATDGTWLYVADSEVSAVRAVPLDPAGKVKTLVGEGLFDFGDVDGPGDRARLQHPLGVAFHGGKVFVADTYNNKIKVIDVASREVSTYLGDGQPGADDKPARFDEPAGLSIADGRLYVADTNNHAVRVVDLKDRSVTTLKLEGVAPPAPAATGGRPTFPNPTTARLAEATLPPGGEISLAVKLTLDAGYKLNAQAPTTYLVETTGAPAAYEQLGQVEDPKAEFTIKVPAEKLAGAKGLKVSVLYYVCQEAAQGLCTVKSHVWDVPVRFDAGSSTRVLSLAPAQ
jgi:thiol-disulfide isomerase/thioredoxin